MEEWKEYKEEKLGNYILDIAAGPFGSNLKVECFVPDGFPIIDGANLKEFKVTDNVTKFVTEEKARSLHRSIAKRNDVVVTISGNVGQISYIPLDSKYEEYLVSQRQFRATFDTTKVYVPYLVYFFHTQLGQHKILSFANQTGVPALAQPLKNFKNIDICLPDISSQKRIASILSSLDDKIEVNRKINENLEQQAQALFKSWFVDFEPFKNGEFVESELGMIPKGWRVGRYDDIIESTISGDWGKENPEGNYTHKVACIRGCDFQDIKNGLKGKTPERYILEKNFQSKHFKDKDVLVEISGGTATVSTGRVCPVSQLLIDKFNEDIVCTNFCRLVRPKQLYGAYLYYSWLYKFNHKVMFGYENGTSGIKNFRIKDFTSIEPIVIPSESSLLSFQTMIDQLQTKLQMNGSESQKLAELRDTLLPKLMSGELKVNEVENSL